MSDTTDTERMLTLASENRDLRQQLADTAALLADARESVDRQVAAAVRAERESLPATVATIEAFAERVYTVKGWNDAIEAASALAEERQPHGTATAIAALRKGE